MMGEKKKKEIFDGLLLYAQLSGPSIKGVMTKPLVKMPARTLGKSNWKRLRERAPFIHCNKLHEQDLVSMPFGLPKSSF